MGAVPRRGIVSTISWHRLRLLFAATCAALPAASAAAAPPGQQERQLRINFAGPSPLQSGDGGCSAGSPAAVTAAARQVCGGRAIAGAVHEIFQVTIADTSEQKLAELGLATVLDLQLLDMAETTELMAELKSSGAGVGERSKLRVLIRDAEQNHKTSWHTASTASSTVQNLKPHVEAREGRQWRKLQESATSSDDERGMSVDTIAIVLSVLLGIVGYIMQALTARRSEQQAAERAQESHLAERKRDREHEQMLTQIQRTGQLLDVALRPLLQYINGHMIHSRHSFMTATVRELETSNPDVVALMMAAASQSVLVDEDGKAKHSRLNVVLWEPTDKLATELTRTEVESNRSARSATSSAIAFADMVSLFGAPYCEEAPQHVLELIDSQPNSMVASYYRTYVRTVLVPAARQVSALLIENAGVLEWPSIAWLEKTFPSIPWRGGSNERFASQWIAYAGSWEPILDMWHEKGDFAVVRPALMQPFSALYAIAGWSITRGEAKQQELVGMTTVSDNAGFDLSRVGLTNPETS